MTLVKKKWLLKLVPLIVICLTSTLVFASSGGDNNGASMTHKMTYFVLQLAVIVVSARLLGFIFSKYLKQPAVLGELCAGMIIGPYALGSIDLPLIGQLFHIQNALMPVTTELYGLATVASIILLFLAGLETDLAVFIKYSVAGTLVGIGGVIGAFFLGDYLAVFFGVATGFMDPIALFLGAISTATSVGITARILSEKRKLDSPEGVTILAGAVIDDVLGIIILAIVIGIAKVGGSGNNVDWGSIGIIAAKAFGFWIVCTALGLILARKITNIMKWFKSTETIASLSLGLALLLAGLSELAGLAMIIGAYITGLSLSRTDVVNELHHRLSGIYSFLVPIFFCVMGMLVDFSAMRGALVFGIVYTVFAVFGKVAGCALPALLMKFNLRGALRIGFGMLPRGEVALIIAGIGLSTGIIGADIFGVSILMTLVTTLIAPPFIVSLFEGKPGIEQSEDDDAQSRTIQLRFPHIDIANFVIKRLTLAFRNEQFFVHRIDSDFRLYQMRKDDLSLSMTLNESTIIITSCKKSSMIARFVIAEEMLELGEAFESLKNMSEVKKMSADLISGAVIAK